MSALGMHTNEKIYPDPYKFEPERWIGPDKVPDKYLISFSKGSRSCLGIKYVLFLPLPGSLVLKFVISNVTSIVLRIASCI
jgi:hypothetical protein